MKKLLAIVLAAILITVPCSSAFASSENLFIGEEGRPVSSGQPGQGASIRVRGYSSN